MRGGGNQDVSNGTLESAVPSEWELLELVRGIGISPEMPVPLSNRSTYGSPLWDWYDPQDERKHTPYKWRIDWARLAEKHGLGPPAIESLKRFVYCKLIAPKTLFGGNISNAIKPNSVVCVLAAMARFLGAVLAARFGPQSAAHSLSELVWEDVRDEYMKKPAARAWAGLRQLVAPAFQRYSGVRLGWTAADVKTLPVPDPGEAWQPLPHGLWAALSNYCIEGIKSFLRATGQAPKDPSPLGDEAPPPPERTPDLPKRIQRFRRLARQSGWSSFISRVNGLRENDRRLHDGLFFVRNQALVVIAQYTGARISELRTFRPGCLIKENDGLWRIRGTVVKESPLSDPTQQDRWLAIPAVIDAVRVLEYTNDFLGWKKSLLSVVYSPKEVTDALNAFRAAVDPDGRWQGEHLHLHRLRHSLALELFRVGVGLPYITYQLHHAYSAIATVANQVTREYGNIGKYAPLRAALHASPNSPIRKAAAEANYEALKAVYDPASPITGGGAEKIIRRRAAYFRGKTRAEIDTELRRQAQEIAAPMAHVGLGLCFQTLAGPEYLPPCLGGLGCNPMECENGIVTEKHLAAWEESLAEDLKRRQDPAYAYGWERLDFFIRYKRQVMAHIQRIIEASKQKKEPRHARTV